MSISIPESKSVHRVKQSFLSTQVSLDPSLTEGGCARKRSWVHPDISPSRGWPGLANWASFPTITVLVLLVGITTEIPVTSWTPWALRVLAVALPTVVGLYLFFFSELSTGFMAYIYPWFGAFMTSVALRANPRHIGPGGQPGTL
jgi:hypothetical protein